MRRNERGQFTIIAALLVTVILVSAVLVTYSSIRNNTLSSQPSVLSAVDETNLALNQLLGFTVGYYGSILQVTGNTTYAQTQASNYLISGLQSIVDMRPEEGLSFNLSGITLQTSWFSNYSYSSGLLNITYNLGGLGIYNLTSSPQCKLEIKILPPTSNTSAVVSVIQDTDEPAISLTPQSFSFYNYSYNDMTWQKVSPSGNPLVFTNGTYSMTVPSGVNPSAYTVQVTDSRGITVVASSFNQVTSTFNMNNTNLMNALSQNSAIIEVLQNGTNRLFGQNLQLATQSIPVPPIPVKAIHVSQTFTNGTSKEVPFQVEDWSSRYLIPLGMTNNYTVFSGRQMIVYPITSTVARTTVWWNGSDTATQTPFAYVNNYFTGDNPGSGTLTNGILTMKIITSGGLFQINSTVGSTTSTSIFMRINNDPSTYGASPAYVIYQGVVRDILQQEAEWGGGAPNCPNIYSNIVLTLPTGASYFTYQLRLMFINSSSQARTITDISPIQLSVPVSSPVAMTENGTSGGLPIVSNASDTFYNYGYPGSWTPHHWSQLINNVTISGAGIMFTDSANQVLYSFDSLAGKATGAIKTNSTSKTIELDPVSQLGSVNYNSILDINWYGAVVTFSGSNPVYLSGNGNTTGLWGLIEQPPPTVITTNAATYTQIDLSPSSGPTGTSVLVSGYGFASNSSIALLFDQNSLGNITSNGLGLVSANATFTVPNSIAGLHTIIATDSKYNSASETFNVTPSVSTNSTNIIPGSVVAVSGSGFAANSTLTAKYDGVSVTLSGTTKTDSFGSFSGTTFTLPATSYGQHLLVVYDSANPQDSGQTSIGEGLTVKFNTPSGMIGDAAGAVLTIDGVNYTYSQLPTTFIWIPGDAHNVTATSAVAAGASKQYAFIDWNGASGLSGTSNNYTVPLSNQTITVNYQTQYQVSFNANPPEGGSTTPTGTSVWIANGTLPIQASLNSGYGFLSWNSSGPITFDNSSALSANAAVNGAGTITASFGLLQNITFAAPSSMSNDAVGTVLTIDGTTYTYAQLPQTFTWPTGSTHLVTATTPTSAGASKQYTWQSWTNGNGLSTASGTFTVPASATVVTANYQAQYQVTFKSSPLAGGSTTPSGTNIWINAGSNSITASANGGYTFTSWTVSGPIIIGDFSSASTTATISGPGNVTANFAPVEGITFVAPNGMSSDAVGTVLTIDGTTYTYAQLPQTFTWIIGTDHSVAASTPISGGSGKQYVWQSWTNGNGLSTASGTFTVPASATVVTANYQAQYQVTFATNPPAGGTVSPSGTNIWVNAGSLSIQATLNSGYGFLYWNSTGAITFANSSAISTTANVNGAGTITASFGLLQNITFAAPSGMNNDAVGTVLTIDGTTYTFAQLPQTFTWPTGSTHSVTATTPTSAGASKQYTWQSWTNGNGLSTASGTFTVPSSNTVVTATYKVQYFLTTTSAFGIASGQGWYDSGSTAYAGLNVGSVDQGNGTQRVFTNWATDASGTNYVQSNAITMNGPKTALAVWKTQYYLTITSSYGITVGQGWYDSGQTPSAGLTVGSVDQGNGTKRVFTNWATDASGTNYASSNPITMSAPKTALAVWKTQYYLTVSSAYSTTVGQGWYDSGTTANAGLNAGSVNQGNNTQRVFINWATDASGTNYASSNPITMSAPKTALAVWKTQYQLNFTVSPAGAGTTAPSGSNVWEDQGSLSIQATPNGGYLFSSWSATGSVSLGNPLSASTTATISGPGTITATFTAIVFGIDSSCTGFASIPSSSSTPITVPALQAQANELIMVVVTQGNSGSSSVRTLTVTDSFSTHLTWTQRGSTVSSGSNAEAISVFYAIADSSHTGLFSVTVTPSSYNRNFDVQVFGITGANTASPFDTNAVLPKSSSSTLTSKPTVSGVSTSNANDIILAFQGDSGSVAETASAPFTSSASLLHNVNSEGCNVEYETVTSTQSSISVTFGNNVSNWVMIVDAVKRGW